MEDVTRIKMESYKQGAGVADAWESVRAPV